MVDREMARRILVIRRDNIGDLVCTTPLLSALRKRFPNAWIGVLANSYNAPVLEGNPDVDKVYSYTKLKHLPPGQSKLAAVWDRLTMVLALRRSGIDEVIIPASGNQRSAARFSRWVAPKRILVASNQMAGHHEVENTFLAAQTLGLGSCPTDARCQVIARLNLVDSLRETLPDDMRGRELIGVHLSARKPSQRWPIERFAELTRSLCQRHGCGVLVFWSPGSADNPHHPGDDEKASEFLRLTTGFPVSLMPTHELAELIAGLSLCSKVICSDGGAMHVAAGLGKRIVCLFGNSSTERWRPWGVTHELLQAPSKDVADIAVAEVSGAFERLSKLANS